MNKNRFCTVNEDIDLVINKLAGLSFKILPDCTNNSYLTKIIIDTVTKTFWRLDQLCFENSIVTIKNQFKEDIIEVNIDDLVLSESKEVDLSETPLFQKEKQKPLESSEITLLDYFAAKAMQGELASQGNNEFTVSKVSFKAYDVAVKMMEIREFDKYNVK